MSNGMTNAPPLSTPLHCTMYTWVVHHRRHWEALFGALHLAECIREAFYINWHRDRPHSQVYVLEVAVRNSPRKRY